MARLLVLDRDVAIVRRMAQALGSREGHQATIVDKDADADLSVASPKIHEIKQIKSFEEFKAIIRAERYDIFYLDISLLGSKIPDALIEIRKECPITENRAAPVVLMDFEESSEKVEQLLKLTVADVLFKPLDEPVFLQKLDILLELAAPSDHELYTQSASGECFIDAEGVLLKLSEVGICLLMKYELKPNEMVSVKLPKSIFQEEELWVMKCMAQKPGPSGTWLTDLDFVALTWDRVEKLRTVIRTQLRLSAESNLGARLLKVSQTLKALEGAMKKLPLNQQAGMRSKLDTWAKKVAELSRLHPKIVQASNDDVWKKLTDEFTRDVVVLEMAFKVDIK